MTGLKRKSVFSAWRSQEIVKQYAEAKGVKGVIIGLKKQWEEITKAYPVKQVAYSLSDPYTKENLLPIIKEKEAPLVYGTCEIYSC